MMGAHARCRIGLRALSCRTPGRRLRSATRANLDLDGNRLRAARPLASHREAVCVRSCQWLVENVAAPEEKGHSALAQLARTAAAQGCSLEVYRAYELDRQIPQEKNWESLAAHGSVPPRQFAAFLHTLRWSCVTATAPRLFQM